MSEVDDVLRYSYDSNGNQTQRIVSDHATNLAANPGFESSSNWSENPSSSFPATSFYRAGWGTADPHGGSYAYAISNHTYGTLKHDDITVLANTSYNLTAWVRGEIDADDSHGSWIIRARFYSSSDAYLGYQDAASGGAGTISAAWAQKGGMITTMANTAYLRIELINYMNSGWVSFDDVSLKRVGYSTELVTNPGFESGDDWTASISSDFPGTSFYRAGWGTADPRSGSYAYTISNHVYGSLQSDLVTITPGVQYDLYAWVRGEVDAEDSEGYWLIRAYFYRCNGKSSVFGEFA